ncbi:hypothetical protein [Singulisphaera sp. PoT]|uniref:hypothetical protein n=1 Tax=Singulisphaera sp. PoT TaxID=3411797 RepID=UPI003BF508CD
MKSTKAREAEPRPSNADPSRPLALDMLLCDLDELLEIIEAKAMMLSATSDDQALAVRALRAARELADQRLSDAIAGRTVSNDEGAPARVDDAWRRAMIETRTEETCLPTASSNDAGGALASLADEMAAYRVHQAELAGEHEGEFVLIKARDVIGVFGDRSAALREGYRRFGVVPFLVRQIAAKDPVVYLPNVTP